MKTKFVRLLAFSLVTLMSLVGSARQDDSDEARKSELGERQRFIERKMFELETRFTVMAEKLREKEPQRAERLIAAYQQSKETLIIKNMSRASQLLDQNKLTEADTLLNDVIRELDKLVRLLTNDPSKEINKQEQIENFEQWKKAIQGLRREQAAQRRETSKVANKDNVLKKLGAQIQKLEELIQGQNGVLKQTSEQENAGIRELDKIADEQFEIRQETEKLASELGEQIQFPEAEDPNGQPSGLRQVGDKPGEQQPGEQQSGEQQPGEQQSGEQQSGEQQAGEQQAGEQQSGEQQSGEQRAGDSQSGDQQSPEQSRKPSDGQPPQPGQQPLRQASDHQRNAEEKLGGGRPKDARREEQKALDEMERALDELRKEHRRLASLPPEAFEQMARKQRRTRENALELIEKMAQAPTPQDANPQDSDDRSQRQQPGQVQMEQASDSMKNAADRLEEQKSDNAVRQQAKAEQKLDEALKEIEERLNQLREETREEKLKRLEARFREMLDRQQVATATTIDVHDKTTSLGHHPRRDQLTVLRLANEELELSELGKQAYDLLLEDGTSDVFPEIVQNLAADLTQAGQLLQTERTDPITQLLQRDIEATLLELLDALKESQQDRQGQGGGGGGGDQPLIKLLAELKMLRAEQQRLNRRTIRLDALGREDQTERPDLKRAVEDLANQQSRLQEMAEKIMEKSDE